MIAFVRGVILRGDVLDVEVHRLGVDVGEDRRRADAGDRLGGRVERERGADHLVARADPERVERDHDRVGAVPDPDRLRDAEIVGRLGLERLHVRAEHEAPVLQHFGEDALQLRDQTRVLRLDVDEGDHGRDASLPGPRALRGRRRHDPPRARRASDHRTAERVLAVDARPRDELLAACASSASASSPTARSARFLTPDQARRRSRDDDFAVLPRFRRELRSNLALVSASSELAAGRLTRPARARWCSAATDIVRSPARARTLPRGERRRAHDRADPRPRVDERPRRGCRRPLPGHELGQPLGAPPYAPHEPDHDERRHRTTTT